MQPIQIELIKMTSNLVKVKLIESEKEIQVPRRVFNRRLQAGIYEVQNPSALSGII